jgi:hypothetical protein
VRSEVYADMLFQIVAAAHEYSLSIHLGVEAVGNHEFDHAVIHMAIAPAFGIFHQGFGVRMPGVFFQRSDQGQKLLLGAFRSQGNDIGDFLPAVSERAGLVEYGGIGARQVFQRLRATEQDAGLGGVVHPRDEGDWCAQLEGAGIVD